MQNQQIDFDILLKRLGTLSGLPITRQEAKKRKLSKYLCIAAGELGFILTFINVVGSEFSSAFGFSTTTYYNKKEIYLLITGLIQSFEYKHSLQ